MPRSTRLSDDFVKTSAFLMREYIGRNRVHASGKAEPTQTIYVFDTDVILTRCAPWITGPLGKGRARHGLGHMFAGRASDKEARERQARNAASVASILARYALDLPRRKTEGSDRNVLPIFQLPSHFLETNNLFRAVRRQVETFERSDRRHSQTRRNLELVRLLALMHHRIASGDNTQATLASNLNRAAQLLTNRSESGGEWARLLDEWDAYFELETQYGGIYSLSDADFFFDEDDALSGALDVLEPSNRSEDEHGLHDELMDYWTKPPPRLRGGLNLEADAAALSDLFLVNLRLAGSRYRCVMISGHRNLVESAFDAPIASFCRNEVRDGPPKTCTDLARRFSLEHIRHLWAYSIEALVDREERAGLVDLFGGLLANWSDPLEIPVETLEHISRQTAPGSGIAASQINNLLIYWEELTQKAIGHSTLELQDAKVRATIRAAFVEKISNKGWSEFIRVLEEDVARVLDRTVLAMSDLGIDQVIKAHKLGRRNPPELVFDSLSHANRLLKQFGSAGAQMTIAEFEEGFARIELDCHDSSHDSDDRQKSYLKFVILGAAFASAEKWMIAHGHARRAIAVIERSKRQRSAIPVKETKGARKTNMSGREAFFLAAVSQRILSRSTRDIDVAVGYLKQAESALSADHGLKTAKNISNVRFLNERLAAHLSRYYLARSRDEGRYFDDVVLQIFAATKSVLEAFDHFSSRRTHPLERVTIVSAATNVIQAYVINEFRGLRHLKLGRRCPATREDVMAALDILRRRTDWQDSSAPGPVISATPLIRVYGLVAEILLETAAKAEESLGQLRTLLKNPKTIAVTAYDEWRFVAVRDFVREWRHG